MSSHTRHPSKFTRQEIQIFFNKAKRVYKDNGLDILCNVRDQHYGRILVITPRKVGTAPERNKVRRRLKALFYIEQLYKKNIDCFIIIKKPGIAYGYKRLKDILCSVFDHIQRESV